MANAFRLDVGEDHLTTLTFDLPGKRVNIFNEEVIAELERVVGELAGRDDIGCLVLTSGKPGTFIAGADVEAIARVEDPDEVERAVRTGQRIFSAWEDLPFPTVAAIDGNCLGGGLELALASTHIVASDRDGYRIGLPEIKLGILPAWGGCTRLPERVGIAAALDIILAGKAVPAKRAHRMGLLDALLPAAGFERYVEAFARKRLDGGKPRRPRRKAGGLQGLLLERNPLGRAILFSQARKRTLAATKGHYPAPLRALEVVRVGVRKGRRAGFDAEARAVAELALSPESKSLVHVFHLMEGVKKKDGLPGGTPREVRSVGVIGAGLMGGGIAHLVADQAGVPVRVKDIRIDGLAAAMEHAAKLLAKRVERKRISKPEAKRRLALIRPTLEDRGFEGCDLIVEAVVERLDVKQKIFEDLDRRVREEAVLATNTSSLPIDRIAERTRRPERVVGMHFFSPVHRMPLVEVVAGERSHPDAVNTVFAFSKKLGKTPVVVRSGPGFLVNRLLVFYTTGAMALLSEGHRIEDVDRAMTSWGMPLGPIALLDEVGIDVALEVGRVMHDAFPDRVPPPDWFDEPLEDDRLGKKSGKGFYLYKGGKRRGPDPEAIRRLGLRPGTARAEPGALVDRMVLPMVNEAARCLEEGLVASPGDLDLAMVFGTGFPPFRGGLCRWADHRGLGGVLAELERLAAEVGERYRPCEPLKRAADAGGFYRHTWQPDVAAAT